MQRSFLFFLIGLFFLSCVRQEKEYYRFKKQVTPSGEYIIYDYARDGYLSFGPSFSGTEVFRKDKKFKEGRGKSIKGAISEWISDDTLLVYNFKSNLSRPKDTFPIKTEYEKVGDFIIKRVFYKSNSGGNHFSDFDSVATTNDSIIIRFVSKENKKDIISFPLGGTTIYVKSDSISYIEIDTRLHKDMNFIYANPDGTVSKGLPHIGTTTYRLTPIKKISPLQIQEKKIFWENL